MAEREDATIAPDQIHGDGDQAEAKRHAERLHHRGGNETRAETFRKQSHGNGEERQQGDEDHHRWVFDEEGALHFHLAPFLRNDRMHSLPALFVPNNRMITSPPRGL